MHRFGSLVVSVRDMDVGVILNISSPIVKIIAIKKSK